ncbi:MAG: hypothetical protein ACX98W_10665 [bacterium]
MQKGIRQELLCEACENDFSKLERYFKRIWFDEGRIPDVLDEEYLVVSGFDYEQVKLFFLSVLWRASVCTVEGFGQVNLGPHEEKIRQILRSNFAPATDRYQIMGRILVSRNGNRVNREFVVTPRRKRLGNQWVYEMVFGSVSWICVVSKQSRGDLAALCLGSPGSILLTRMFIDQYDAAQELYLAGRLDYT